MKLRFKFMSHEAIMKASKSPVIEPFRDFLIEGLSSKLKPFEDTSNAYSVLMEPRTNYVNARTNPNGGQAQNHFDMTGPQTQQTHMAGMGMMNLLKQQQGGQNNAPQNVTIQILTVRTK